MKIHPPQPVNKGKYSFSCLGLMRTGTTWPAFACRPSTCRLGRLQGGISGRAAWPKANWQACSVPLSLLQKQRRNGESTRDPRPSIQERYKNRDDYVQQISRAARVLVDQRYLLPEDAERMIAEAKKRHVR